MTGIWIIPKWLLLLVTLGLDDKSLRERDREFQVVSVKSKNNSLTGGGGFRNEQSHLPADGGCVKVVRKECESTGVATQQKWVVVPEWLFQTCSAPRTAPTSHSYRTQNGIWQDETHPAGLEWIWTQMRGTNSFAMRVLCSHQPSKPSQELLQLLEKKPLWIWDWDWVKNFRLPVGFVITIPFQRSETGPSAPSPLK